MSKYTTEIRFLCESFNDNKPGGYASIDENIQAGIPHIFSFDFPMFDESYRNVLCTKILRHYYTREIGEETFGLWKLRLETKLNEIMPYYNKLYKSGLDTFNPLWDTQMTTEYVGNKKGETDTAEKVDTTTKETEEAETTRSDSKTSTIGSESSNKSAQEQTGSGTTRQTSDKMSTDRFSETPQGGLDGLISNDYLTNARIVQGDETAESTQEDTVRQSTEGSGRSKYDEQTGTEGKESRESVKTRDEGVERGKNDKSTSTEDYVIKVNGRQGTDVAKAIAALKETLLNIDMMIINDLEVLFMNIW